VTLSNIFGRRLRQRHNPKVPLRVCQEITFSELDLSSILKASQTLSGEIVLTTLLEKIMKIVLENAGAQKGYLILKSQLEPENKNEQWVIEASGTVDNNEFKIFPSIPIETVGGNSHTPITLPVP
jgi:hypothetical protein